MHIPEARNEIFSVTIDYLCCCGQFHSRCRVDSSDSPILDQKRHVRLGRAASAVDHSNVADKKRSRGWLLSKE
jgi:hypothetical protein